MEIKGVTIQNDADYYKILSVIKNREDITIKELKALNNFLKDKKTKEESINIFSENRNLTQENKGFSAIRGLDYKESYSFFRVE